MICSEKRSSPADEHQIIKMVASMLVRLLIFIIYLAHVSCALENPGSISRAQIIDLITIRIQEKDCNIPMDNSTFSACDRPFIDLSTVSSKFFRNEYYLCMGVYDVVLHICDLEKNNPNLSSSIQEVMKEMNGVTKHEMYGVQNICNRMKTIKFETGNPELEPWIRELNSTLQIQKSCDDTCTKGHEVNPLCIFVLWGNTLPPEPKVEKENVADMNVNTSKLSKKADEKTLNSQPSDKSLNSQPSDKSLNSQPSDKSLRQSKIQPSPMVGNADASLLELDGNHNKPEEVTSKRQEDATTLDETNYEIPVQEDQDNKSSDEPKISTSVETDTKQSQTTSSSNEAANDLETDADVTNFGDHPKDEMASVALPEPPTTAWKSTSFAKNDVELTDSALPSGYRKHFDNAEDSHFFAYFMAVVVICIIGYLIYHNKHKLLALILEGRRRREMRRRTTHGGYRKLDSSLEEAVTSTCNTSVTHVIY